MFDAQLDQEKKTAIAVLDNTITDEPMPLVVGDGYKYGSATFMALCYEGAALTARAEFSIDRISTFALSIVTLGCIRWICALPGHGSALIEYVERWFRERGTKRIRLICSLEEGESLNTRLRRINFYIKHHYRVANIESFSGLLGPNTLGARLTMEKTLVADVVVATVTAAAAAATDPTETDIDYGIAGKAAFDLCHAFYEIDCAEQKKSKKRSIGK